MTVAGEKGCMYQVVLFQPEIPPNTGNVIRLCANVGASLHLIQPLGFALDDARLRRAGLDYREFAAIAVHADLDAFHAAARPSRVFALSTRGQRRFDQPRYAPGDAFLFGPESRGLPASVLQALDPAQVLRLPLRPGNRSLNLSNAVAVTVFEAWRQMNYGGSE